MTERKRERVSLLNWKKFNMFKCQIYIFIYSVIESDNHEIKFNKENTSRGKNYFGVVLISIKFYVVIKPKLKNEFGPPKILKTIILYI